MAREMAKGVKDFHNVEIKVKERVISLIGDERTGTHNVGARGARRPLHIRAGTRATSETLQGDGAGQIFGSERGAERLDIDVAATLQVYNQGVELVLDVEEVRPGALGERRGSLQKLACLQLGFALGKSKLYCILIYEIGSMGGEGIEQKRIIFWDSIFVVG